MQSGGLEDVANFTRRAERRVVQPVRKSFHLVDFRRGRKLFAALAEPGENRDPAADHVFHVDLVARRSIDGDQKAGATYVFQPRILHPKIFGRAFVDGDGGGDVAEMRPYQRDAGRGLADGRLALALEIQVDRRELPAWRWHASPDAIAASEKAHILHHIAGVMDAGQTASGAKVHVRQETVLRIGAPHADGARIALADLNIHVAHGGVECAGSGIRRAGGRGGSACGTGGSAPPGEKHDVVFFLGILKSWCAGRQHQDRAAPAPADHPYAGPDVDGAGDLIPSLSQKNDALAGCFLNPVDGFLDCFGVIGRPVAGRPAFARGKIHGAGIVQADGVVRCGFQLTS